MKQGIERYRILNPLHGKSFDVLVGEEAEVYTSNVGRNRLRDIHDDLYMPYHKYIRISITHSTGRSSELHHKILGIQRRADQRFAERAWDRAELGKQITCDAIMSGNLALLTLIQQRCVTGLH